MQGSRGSRVFGLVLAIPFCWLAWQIITIAVSDYYSLTQPERALWWDADHARALAALAEQQLPRAVETVEARPAVTEIAREALLGEPLSSVPLRVLAVIAEEAGDEARAKSLMEMAAARSRRDVQTQIWLADYDLLSGKYLEAFDRIDALLRVWPDIGDTLLPLLAELAVQAESADAVLLAFQAKPPWRSSVLARLPESAKDRKALAGFYSRLQESDAPPTASELRPYLQSLIDHGDADLAYKLWADSRPAGLKPTPGELYNGDFEYPVSGLPFDWTIKPVRGSLARVTASGSDTHALRVEFHNTRVPFKHVSQILLLKPGAYRLTGRVRAIDLRNERGMQWSAVCAGDNKEKVGETRRFSGTTPWSDFEMPLLVPDRDECRTQLLRLELAARIPAEQRISGEVWFDALSIEPTYN